MKINLKPPLEFSDVMMYWNVLNVNYPSMYGHVDDDDDDDDVDCQLPVEENHAMSLC
jgi:hypothetical protein